MEFEFPAKRIFSIQSQLEKLINQNYYLNKVSSSFHFSWALTLVGRLTVCICSQLKRHTVPIFLHTRLTVWGLSLMFTSWSLPKWPKVSAFPHRHALTSRWAQAWAETRRKRGGELTEVNRNKGRIAIGNEIDGNAHWFQSRRLMCGEVLMERARRRMCFCRSTHVLILQGGMLSRQIRQYLTAGWEQ